MPLDSSSTYVPLSFHTSSEQSLYYVSWCIRPTLSLSCPGPGQSDSSAVVPQWITNTCKGYRHYWFCPNRQQRYKWINKTMGKSIDWLNREYNPLHIWLWPLVENQVKQFVECCTPLFKNWCHLILIHMALVLSNFYDSTKTWIDQVGPGTVQSTHVPR